MRTNDAPTYPTPEHPLRWLCHSAALVAVGALAGSLAVALAGSQARRRAQALDQVLALILSLPDTAPLPERSNDAPEPVAVGLLFDALCDAETIQADATRCSFCGVAYPAQNQEGGEEGGEIDPGIAAAQHAWILISRADGSALFKYNNYGRSLCHTRIDALGAGDVVHQILEEDAYRIDGFKASVLTKGMMLQAASVCVERRMFHTPFIRKFVDQFQSYTADDKYLAQDVVIAFAQALHLAREIEGKYSDEPKAYRPQHSTMSQLRTASRRERSRREQWRR